MCARILRFPDGAVLPQPARRKLAVSIQDWLGEEFCGIQTGPQLVVNTRRTEGEVSDRTEAEDGISVRGDATVPKEDTQE